MKHSVILGSGYVGAELARQLLRAGHHVSTVNRSGEGVDGAVAVRADLADSASLAQSITQADFIFLTVAADSSDEDSYRRAYIEGARSLDRLAVSLAARRIVFTSSSGVYAQDDGSWVDEASLAAPGGFRGRTMLSAEKIVLSSSVPSTVLRLSGIYGPGRNRLMRVARDGKAVDRRRYTNRIHRDDAAGALAHLCELESPSSLYLVSDSAPTMLHEVLDWIADELNAVRCQPPAEDQPPGGKRCRNVGLLSSGFSLRYPSFREGYAEMLRG